MNWTDFILYLTLLYVVYYAFIILLDVFKNPQKLFDATNGELFSFQPEFSSAFPEPVTIVEDDQPIIEKSNPPSPPIANPKEQWINSEEDTEEIELLNENIVKSTGGVSTIGALFSLAKSDAIEMKKGVVF